MIRVLVIEDDGETAAEIVEDFTSAGFAVDREITGPGGLRRAQTDSITLDRMLPGMDGLTLLDRLRASGVRTPVLVLSALSSVDERIRGLRAGGDDDLSKPFATAELRARVEVMARRPPDREQTSLRCADLVLDLFGRVARRGPRVLDLVPREFRLLGWRLRRRDAVPGPAGDGRGAPRPPRASSSDPADGRRLLTGGQRSRFRIADAALPRCRCGRVAIHPRT